VISKVSFTTGWSAATASEVRFAFASRAASTSARRPTLAM
jgi:hypothetical protein